MTDDIRAAERAHCIEILTAASANGEMRRLAKALAALGWGGTARAIGPGDGPPDPGAQRYAAEARPRPKGWPGAHMAVADLLDAEAKRIRAATVPMSTWVQLDNTARAANVAADALRILWDLDDSDAAADQETPMQGGKP